MTCIATSPRTNLLSHPKPYHDIYKQLEATGAPVHDRKNHHTLLPPPTLLFIGSSPHKNPKTCTVLLPKWNPPLSLRSRWWQVTFRGRFRARRRRSPHRHFWGRLFCVRNGWHQITFRSLTLLPPSINVAVIVTTVEAVLFFPPCCSSCSNLWYCFHHFVRYCGVTQDGEGGDCTNNNTTVSTVQAIEDKGMNVIVDGDWNLPRRFTSKTQFEKMMILIDR